MLSSQASSVSVWAWLLLSPVLITGFFLPGYLLFQRLRTPLPWLTSFIGSGLILFQGVLILELTPLRLSLFSLSLFLGLMGLIGWRLRPSPLPKFSWPQGNWRGIAREWWWGIPVTLSILSVLLHAYFEPLAGFDNFFRWNYLAQLMEAQGSLAHYPPMTALDFRFYPWCDGIPPLVPILNLWIYLGTGSSAGVLIVGRLLVELALTLALIWHVSNKLWGATGARISLLAVSTSTLFLWSLSIQQETGVSGIAYLALCALLLDYRNAPNSSTAIWLGLTAGFGALCRDYNLILIPVTLIGVYLAKASKRDLLLTTVAAVLVTLPWYLRNFWITGNPLFPHDLGGLFPTNLVHHDYMQAIRDTYSYANTNLPQVLLQGFFISAGALFLLSLPGLFTRQFGSHVIVALVLVSLSLCLLAVPSTAGGPYYALRILGPALPLLAIASGRLAQWQSPRRLAILGLALLPLSADAARRSWIFPWFPTASPWNYTWNTWRQIDQFIRDSRNDPLWAQLKKVAQGESVVILHPSQQVLLFLAGGNPIPLFSPEIEALTHSGNEQIFSEAIETLRRKRVRFVILTDDGLQNTRYFRSKPVSRELLSMEPALRKNSLLIYDLVLIQRQLKTHAP